MLCFSAENSLFGFSLGLEVPDTQLNAVLDFRKKNSLIPDASDRATQVTHKIGVLKVAWSLQRQIHIILVLVGFVWKTYYVLSTVLSIP